MEAEPIVIDWKWILLLYMTVMTIVGIVVMWSDKRRAIRHMHRISERMLFFVALIGGAFGSCIGMWAFRHKTRHWYFVVFMPLIMIIQIAAIAFVFANY